MIERPQVKEDGRPDGDNLGTFAEMEDGFHIEKSFFRKDYLVPLQHSPT